MYGTWLKKSAIQCLGLALLLLTLSCGRGDGPLSVLPEAPPVGPAVPPGGPAGGCFVQFKSLMQLKVSANPAGDPLEVLDANPVDLAPIPIQVEGSKLSLKGDTFPEIILTRLSEQADLRIKGAPGVTGTGSYNPDTGEIKIEGFKFTLEILTKGTTERFLDGESILDNIQFVTGSVTATGNLNPITESGAPLNKDDRTLALAVGLSLPKNFAQLSVLDSMIGGGALTARFEGVLDLLPENCGSGSPGSFPGGGVEQPAGLKVSIQDQAGIGEIDFGTSAVVLKTEGESKVIDCLEASNRQIVSRTVTIANVGTEAKTIVFSQPQDTDYDRKSPLCGGKNEFVRGTITEKEGADCKTLKVGGKDFLVGECTLPPGNNASISFPLMYLPFNYLDPGAGNPTISDLGFFSFNHGAEKPFSIQLKGGTIPDFRDVFSVSKVVAGVVSKKEIRNKGTLKVQLDTSDPFSQTLVLKNSGGDDWENLSFTLDKGTVFSIEPPTVNRLPAAEGGEAGKTDWKLKFTPGGDAVNNDTLTIRMVQVGSVTPETPAGVESRIVLNLLGTVGIPRLSGEILMQFDYLTALMDHIALDRPTESIDYRHATEIAPEPIRLIFHDTDHEDIKKVELIAPVADILDPSLSVRDRERVLRVFTSRASIGKNGERLTSGDGSDKCYEADSITIPYQGGDCSYFYHNIISSDMGIYDDETGHMSIPNIVLRMQNPYHADIIGKWPASNPNANPDYLFDANLNMTFTTHIIDRDTIEEGGESIDLLPDDRISPAELVVKSKPLGDPCPEGIFDGAEPNFKCFLSTGDRYLEGKAVTLKPNQIRDYDLVLVGVAQFPSLIADPELPWFIGENGGSKFFIAILGRLYKAEP